MDSFVSLRNFAGLFAVSLAAACAAGPVEEAGSTAGALGGKRDAGTVTLHFYPRQKAAIDYRSPASTLLSFATDQRVGHTMVDVKCERPSGDTFELLTGQTGSENDEEYIDAGWGFKILDLSFPGYLQASGDVQRRLEQLAKEGKSSFIRVKVNGDACERMAKFHEGYVANGDEKNFGLQLRPRYHEGGGCTSFGVTFLEVAGVLTREHEEKWRQTLDVPNDLIGDPKNDKKVSKTTVITRFSWAKSDQPSTRAIFWEPNLIHQWIIDARKAAKGNVKAVEDGIVPGLEIDARDVAAPVDPIFLAEGKKVEETPAPGDKMPESEEEEAVHGPDFTE